MPTLLGLCKFLLLHLAVQDILCLTVSTTSSSSARLEWEETGDASGLFDIRLVGGGEVHKSSHHPSITTTNADASIVLQSREIRLGPYSFTDKTLVRVGPPIASDGTDVFGTFEGYTWSWATQEDPETIRMETTIYSYPSDDPGILVFEQHFPKEFEQQRHNNKDIFQKDLSSQTAFPSFLRNPGPSDSLDTLSYHGVFPKLRHSSFSNYNESHQGGVPLVLYNKSDSSSSSGINGLPMVVFSPLSWVKASHMASTHNWVGGGIKSSVDIIPKGWTQRFLLSAGYGINQGMMDWGDRMLKYHHDDDGISHHHKKKRDNPYKYRDAVHSTIGFWTDNGGYYHYNLGNVSRDATYGDVLPQVKQYHDVIGVPFGHWQFDSWFYPKDGPVNKGGGGGAVVNWTALEKVFPTGMAGIQQKLQVPMVMHNRQWSVENDYRNHWTDIEWYADSSKKGMKAAIPKDPLAFFTRFFTTMEGWGLSMYEQDWMCTQYDVCPVLQSNISMADLWLSGMAQGAAFSNRTVQYCMPYPTDVLSAVAYPAVTNARASDDYANVASQQWNIAPAALFYWAIGILPFKDGFYSSSLPQIGGQMVGPETNPDREIIMATLSCAIVGPMDGIHLLNKTRVMASCNSAGHVLKPDRPVTMPDYCFTDFEDPADCPISATYSDVGGYRVHYVFDNISSGYYLPAMSGLGATSPFVVYNWYTRSVRQMSAQVPMEPGYEGHAYAVLLPVLSGWAFLGEIDKYVTVSNVRFSKIIPNGDNDDGIVAIVEGQVSEKVRVCAVAIANLTDVVCQILNFVDGAGTQRVVFPSRDGSEVALDA